MLSVSTILFLLKWGGCLVAGIWVITIVRGNGLTERRFVNSSQTRDEMMNRSKSAIEKQTGKPVQSKRTRGGFWNFNDDININGQYKK